MIPARVDAYDQDKARTALAADGAVVLTGLAPTPDAPVVAAALVLGDRLRELFPVRERRSRDGGPVHLHAHSFDVVVDVGGVPHRRRHPDEDYVLVQCVRPPRAGGDSFVVDAYGISFEPELAAFLTDVDVDLYGAWAGLRGLPATPSVARHVEFTRTGRRIVRRTDGAAPLRRDPLTEHVVSMLARFDAAVLSLESGLPRFPLVEGDILLLDNYRCWHGRDPHSGDRLVRILTLRSEGAR